MKKAHVDRMVKIIGEWLHTKRAVLQGNDLLNDAHNEDHLIEALRAHQWRRYETAKPKGGWLVLRKTTPSDLPSVCRYREVRDGGLFEEGSLLMEATPHTLWMYIPE